MKNTLILVRNNKDADLMKQKGIHAKVCTLEGGYVSWDVVELVLNGGRSVYIAPDIEDGREFAKAYGSRSAPQRSCNNCVCFKTCRHVYSMKRVFLEDFEFITPEELEQDNDWQQEEEDKSFDDLAPVLWYSMASFCDNYSCKEC